MANIKPDNVIRVPSTRHDVFDYWLSFLQPIHQLTNREIELASCYLREYESLRKVILDKDLLEKTLMSKDTQKKIRTSLNMTSSCFQVLRSNLKNKKFLIQNKINPKMIPNIKEDGNSFLLMLYFEIRD